MTKKTPAELIADGEKTLPCGYPLDAPFKERLRHYMECQDEYCASRFGDARAVAGQIAAALRRTKDEG